MMADGYDSYMEVDVPDALQLPFEKPSPFLTAPLLRELQAAGPVHRIRTAVGDEAWLVTDYQQVRSLLDDDRLGRSHPDPAHAARTGESALFGGPLGSFETERADHARMRSLLQSALALVDEEPPAEAEAA